MYCIWFLFICCVQELWMEFHRRHYWPQAIKAQVHLLGKATFLYFHSKTQFDRIIRYIYVRVTMITIYIFSISILCVMHQNKKHVREIS